MKPLKNINFIDFKAEYKEISKDIEESLKRVFNSGYYILGREVSSFEKKISSYIGKKYAIAVASGTDALTLAIKALRLEKADSVLMPANVYPSVFGCALSGVKVRLCDVDPDSLNINLETVNKAFTKDVKAILAVHLYGNPVDLDPIKKFAKNKGVFLIEDCAQSIGSIYKNKKTGFM